jgi:glycosyltransferase involved in cell wall biosynthesis
VVAGDGPLKGEVINAAHDDPSITYLGAVSPAEVANVLRNASGLIVPSLWFEGFPLTVVEAFSHGRPVVVTSGGSAASVVDESCGWVIPPDPSTLTDLIINWNDDEAARRGMAARQTYLERYTSKVATDLLLDIYAQVLRDRERPAR